MAAVARRRNGHLPADRGDLGAAVRAPGLSAGTDKPYLLCARACREHLSGFLSADGDGRDHFPSLADEACRCCCKGGRTARCLVHRAGAGVRIHLGSGHLGNLVGLGRATDFSAPAVFLVAGCCVAQDRTGRSEGAARACALLSIVGCINVVVIKYSVDWWNTLHQPSTNFTLATDQANGPEIWVPLIFMIVAVYLFFAISLILSTRNEILQREKRAQWVMDLVAKS